LARRFRESRAFARPARVIAVEFIRAGVARRLARCRDRGNRAGLLPASKRQQTSSNHRPVPDLQQPSGSEAALPGPNSLRNRLTATFAALRIRNYRLFFIGQGISLVGTWVRRTAMGWLVYELTGSTVQLGLVMGLALLPMFVLSPWAGAIADRVDKRRMIIFTQVMATATSAAIAALIFLHCIQVWHLMVISTLSGVAFAFEVPTRQSFIVEMVGRDKLMNAIALNSGLVNLSRVLGPALAGLLMGSVGMGSCFALDALSYVVVTVTLFMLQLPDFEKRAQPQSQWESLVEGAREVRRNRRVGVILTLLAAVGVFGWSFETLMPAIARDLMKLQAIRYGVLMSLLGVGATAGALFVASRTAGSNRRAMVFGGVWMLVAAMYLVAMLGAVLGASSAAFWGVGSALLLAGMGAVTFMSTANTLVQTSVDDRIRGRIMGIWAVAFGGSIPLGSFMSGFVARAVSPFIAIAAFGTVLLAVSLTVYFRLPSERTVARTSGFQN
jgi:MFS family permease